MNGELTIRLCAASLLALFIGWILFRSILKDSDVGRLENDRYTDTLYVKSTDSDSATNYYRCLENIMMTEGFSHNPYMCPAGSQTIGFGHKINEGEKFFYLSFHDAYKLMKSDFAECMQAAYCLGFTANKHLAVSHAIYCLGLYNVQKIYAAGPSEKFMQRLSQYVHYTTPEGKKERSESLVRSRQFERELFYKQEETK